MDLNLQLPDDLGLLLQQKLASSQALSESEYVAGLLRQHLQVVPQKPATSHSGKTNSKKLNWKAIREDSLKFAVYLAYWASTAGLISIIHLISQATGWTRLDPADAATDFVLEIMSEKHVLPIVSGPFLILIITLAIYLPIKNKPVRRRLSVIFDKSFEVIGEQLYHVVALLVVFTVAAYIGTGFWGWIASSLVFLGLEVCLLAVFGGGRTIESHEKPK